MSIASEITRLGSLRDTIRSKLISAGIISNTSAKLSECATAIDGMAVNSKVSKVLDTSTTSVAIPKGYHKEAGTVSISVQEKTQNITSGTATVSPDSGKVLKKVTVNGPTSYAGTTQVASGVTQDDDNTYFAVPKSGYYDTNSKIAAKNSDLDIEFTYYQATAQDANDGYGYTYHPYLILTSLPNYKNFVLYKNLFPVYVSCKSSGGQTVTRGVTNWTYDSSTGKLSCVPEWNSLCGKTVLGCYYR